MIRWVPCGASVWNSRIVSVPLNADAPDPPVTSNWTVLPPETSWAWTPAPLDVTVVVTAPLGVLVTLTGMNTGRTLGLFWLGIAASTAAGTSRGSRCSTANPVGRRVGGGDGRQDA